MKLRTATLMAGTVVLAVAGSWLYEDVAAQDAFGPSRPAAQPAADDFSPALSDPGQQRDSSNHIDDLLFTAQNLLNDGYGRKPGGGGAFAQPDPRTTALWELNQLRTTLRDRSGKERDETVALAKTKLSEYFDHDTEHRRSELDRLQKRAADTESRLDKRAASKDKMIDLEIKSVGYEAAGLLLFENSSGASDPFGSDLMMSMMGSGGVDIRHVDMDVFVSSMDDRRRGQDSNDNQPTPQQRVDVFRKKLLEAIAASNTDADDVVKEYPQQSAALKSALSDFFDADLKARKQELTEIRKGLDDMSQRIDKRVQLKDKIVELELQMFVNEADGLGFFSSSNASQNAWRQMNMPQFLNDQDTNTVPSSDEPAVPRTR